MAIKINTAYGERLTSSMLNEKISGIVGENEKVNGFDVSINTSTSVAITPGRAYVNGCSIEETSNTNVSLDEKVLSNDGVAYIVLSYTHTTQQVEFSCVTEVTSNMAKLATLTIENGAITELINHEHINTLNTVVGASADIEAQKIRDAIPSGFVEMGQLDYDYMLNHENEVKIGSKSVAYINGYRVEIPANIIINIGKAPEKELREDLLFLEAWKDSDFAKNGKLKWRIRHVADVDFNNTSFADGLAYQGGALASSLYTRLAFPQGGNIIPLSHSDYINDNERFTGIFRTASLSTYDWQKTPYSDDKGLFISKLSKNKTLDGYVYAIPMFRLYRKPSCGKSMPFEYSKINPKVDYSKFVKLMKEEKVERVITENIKGRSLINLSQGLGIIGCPMNTSIYHLKFDSALLENCKQLTLIKRSKGVVHLEITGEGSATNMFVLESEPNTKKLLTVTNEISFGRFRFYRADSDYDNIYNSKGARGLLDDIVILEGDWTNKEIPAFFTGHKSLGEDDGNLITVKNGILSDDTYDINDGNQKLTTVPQVTYVLSKNTIIPKIQANVKRGEEVIKSLNELGTKLTTDGTEEIEFIKIKGRTIQNCYPIIATDSFNHLHGTVSNGYVTLQGSANYQNAFIPMTKCLIKPNTTYTMVVNVIENTLIKDFILASNNPTDVFKKSETKVLKGKTGTHKFLVTSAEQLEGERYGLRSFLSENETGKIKFKVMLLEGNYTSVDFNIPYIEGIVGVGDQCDNDKYRIEVVAINNNLCSAKTVSQDWLLGTFDTYISDNTNGYHSCEAFAIPHLANKRVYAGLIREGIGIRDEVAFAVVFDKNKVQIGSRFGISKQGYILPSNAYYIRLMTYVGNTLTYIDKDIYYLGLEPLIARKAYAPYQDKRVQLTLNEPLMSLPNGVYDEIVGNKVIRRIGKVILDGSENWSTNHNQHATLKWHSLDNHITLKGDNDSSARHIICDKLTVSDANLYHVEIQGIFLEKTREGSSRIQINSTESDIRAWLKRNPVTFYYELANPTEEYLENVYEKESIKTYQLDAPLRSLPNGVKDEIKDGVLIRRCKEVIFDGSDDEGWMALDSTNPKDNHLILCKTSPSNVKANNGNPAGILANNIISKYTWHIDAEGVWIDGNGNTYVSVAKTRLTPIDKSGFTKWLSKNPLRVICELISPIETILTEITPQTANFSLQRQFAEGNWLRELPNGVRDTIENGKVKRKVKKVTLNGTEAWREHTAAPNQVDTIAFYLADGSVLGASSKDVQIISSLLDGKSSSSYNNADTEGIAIGNTSAYAYIVKIKRSKISPVDAEGFKAWLTKNPITCLVALANPTDETLTDKNCLPYPCHDFNTYCGSMYVGDGRNCIVSDNKMPSEDSVVIETDFRKIEGGARVGDCKYKKCDDGYDTSYISGSGKNLLDTSIDNILNTDYFLHYNYTKLDNGFRISNKVANPYSSFRFRVHLKAGVSYRVEYNKTGDHSFVDLKTLKLGYIRNLGNGTVFTVDATGYYSVNFYCTGQSPTIATATFTNVSIVEGESSIPFEPYIKTKKYLEGIEENDIEDLRHQVSLTGFNYDDILQKSFDKLLRGEL